MAIGIGTVVVKQSRGKLVVQGLGKTPRGTNFIRAREVLTVKRMSDPKFKAELAVAVAKLLSETSPTG